MAASAPNYWQSTNLIACLLLPVSWLFAVVVSVRRWCYQTGVINSYRAAVPVIVVGNITAGGAGKTPLVIALVQHLQTLSLTVGVISGGYGGSGRGGSPVFVDSDSDPSVVGDEAVLIAQRTGVPVVVAKERANAARELSNICDVLLCDDGLQHYALQRDIEIAVVDATRVFGNGMLMPAGPLRESVGRLQTVDLVCYSGRERKQPGYELFAESAINIRSGTSTDLSTFANTTVHAVCAIAYPEKFFTLLKRHGLKLVEHRFADHHLFTASDLQFADQQPIVMTEKDMVKCRAFSDENTWYLPVHAQLDADFLSAFDHLLTQTDLVDLNE